MLKRYLVIFMTLFGLTIASSAMAGGCRSYYGSSTDCGYEQRGGSNSEFLGITGFAVGAAAFKENPVVGAVMGLALGHYAGRSMDQQEAVAAEEEARRAAEEGQTNCRWRATGELGLDHKYHVTGGTSECAGSNSSIGNRTLPPPPRD